MKVVSLHNKSSELHCNPLPIDVFGKQRVEIQFKLNNTENLEGEDITLQVFFQEDLIKGKKTKNINTFQ